jgi:carboxylesterase
MHEHSIERPQDWWHRFTAWLREATSTLVRRNETPLALTTSAMLASQRAARAEAERRYAFRMQGRRIGCLLVHGLSSTPQSVRALGEAFAARGIDVEAVLLPGHGTSPEDLETTNWEQWYEVVRGGLDRLRPRCDRMFVCGQSMGGALALRAAAREPLDGVITLAGFVFLKDWRLRFLPAFKYFQHWRKCIGNDIADPSRRDEVCYDRIALSTIEQLVALGDAVRSDLSKIEVPALVIQSRVDHVVPPETADLIYDTIASTDRELVRLENSYHVISMDFDFDIVVERSVRFMRRVAYAEQRAR